MVFQASFTVNIQQQMAFVARMTLYLLTLLCNFLKHLETSRKGSPFGATLQVL